MADAPMIWNGSKLLLLSGTVMSISDDQPLDFDIFSSGVAPRELVRVRFAFVSDPGGAIRAEYGARDGSQTNTTDPPTFILRFFNLDRGGVFADGPLRIGKLGNVAVWFTYEVAALIGRPQVKKVTYSFWEGPVGDPSGTPFGRRSG